MSSDSMDHPVWVSKADLDIEEIRVIHNSGLCVYVKKIEYQSSKSWTLSRLSATDPKSKAGVDMSRGIAPASTFPIRQLYIIVDRGKVLCRSS